METPTTSNHAFAKRAEAIAKSLYPHQIEGLHSCLDAAVLC